MLFKGEKVRLRKMTGDDVKDFHRWQNDMEIAPLINPFIDLQSIEDVQDNFKGMLTAEHRKNYIIEHIEDEKAIGYMGLFNINHYQKNAECYIALCENQYRGKGHGSEAMTLLMDYVFSELNLHRLSLRVFADNDHAIHMYKNLGFSQEGRLREMRYRNGTWQDSLIMSILQKEYE